MIELGDSVRDPITGYAGVALAKTVWLHGCVRIGVQSQELHDGKPHEEQWFDEARLVGATVPTRATPIGGPARPIGKRADPSR